MEKKLCKACLLEKSIDSFYRCQRCIGGRLGICKICKSKGKKVIKEDKIHRFNQMWRMSDDRFFCLKRVTREDYNSMWELLEKMGYDVNENIHKQFVDKVNKVSDTPIRFKKTPMDRQPRWWANGDHNPKKKPPISE